MCVTQGKVDAVRMFITGAAGAGKTHLARQLAPRFGVPHHELDTGVPAVEPTRAGWVIEGSSPWDAERFVDAADVVVWLDLPLRHTIPRIVRRHVRLSVTRKNPHRGVRLLWSFLRSQPPYHRAPFHESSGPTDWAAHTRANHERLARRNPDRLVHLRTPRAVRRWRRTV